MPALNWTISLLVGLGNPGLLYTFTRHNMGFLLLDALVKSKGSCWEENKKCKCQVAVVAIGSHKIYCIKPQTFMNLSGEAVQAFCHYFKLKTEEVLVICDDVTIPWLKFKVSTIPGDAGHNGLKSIVSHLGNGFVRYRIGLGSPTMQLNNFVLGRLSEKEIAVLPEIAKKFEKNIEVLIDKGVIKGLNFIER